MSPPFTEGRSSNKLEQAFQPNLHDPRPSTLPMADMIGFLAETNTKVLANICSLRLKKLVRLLPPLGPRRRKYYLWGNDTTSPVPDLPSAATRLLDNRYLFNVIRQHKDVSFGVGRLEVSSNSLAEVSSWLAW